MRYLGHSFLLHLLALLLLLFLYRDSPKIEKKRIVQVKTVRLAASTSDEILVKKEPLPLSSPPPPPSPPVPEEKEVKKAAPKKETPKEEPKKQEPKKVAKKEEVKKTPPPIAIAPPETKKNVVKADPKKEALLKEARESLAKMGKIEATSQSTNRNPPKSLGSLKAEEGLSFVKGLENDLYSGELVKRLKLNLRLPESGEVVIDLTLQRSGKVARIKIREAKSSINRNYVEGTLPTLNFPSFGEYYPLEDEKLFTFTLQNALY